MARATRTRPSPAEMTACRPMASHRAYRGGTGGASGPAAAGRRVPGMAAGGPSLAWWGDKNCSSGCGRSVAVAALSFGASTHGNTGIRVCQWPVGQAPVTAAGKTDVTGTGPVGEHRAHANAVRSPLGDP